MSVSDFSSQRKLLLIEGTLQNQNDVVHVKANLLTASVSAKSRSIRTIFTKSMAGLTKPW
jgi:hypothetical protein